MSYKTLVAAGWITMIGAFIALPLTYLMFKLEGRANLTAQTIQTLIQVFGTVLFVVITRYMKTLLNLQFAFHDTDRYIDLMIMANVVAGVLVLAGLFFSPLKETLGIAALVIMVFQGIVQIQFGYGLLKLQENIGGMLKPFCYANMLTGLCVASVVLIIVGVVVSAIADLMLGTIFLNIAKQVRYAEANSIDA
ncbi:MAG: hypothetical protein WCD00_02180 [Desulfuromonadaceae bacterium]